MLSLGGPWGLPANMKRWRSGASATLQAAGSRPTRTRGTHWRRCGESSPPLFTRRSPPTGRFTGQPKARRFSPAGLRKSFERLSQPDAAQGCGGNAMQSPCDQDGSRGVAMPPLWWALDRPQDARGQGRDQRCSSACAGPAKQPVPRPAFAPCWSAADAVDFSRSGQTAAITVGGFDAEGTHRLQASQWPPRRSLLQHSLQCPPPAMYLLLSEAPPAPRTQRGPGR